MLPEWLFQLLVIASPIFAAGGAWAGTRVTLHWHRQEIERAHKRLDAHDQIFMDQLRGTGL